MHLCGAYADHRRLDQLAFVAEGVEGCDPRGLELWRRYLVVNLAEMQLALGQWDDGVDVVTPILASPGSAPMLQLVAWCVAARVRLRRGDPGADDALREAERTAE